MVNQWRNSKISHKPFERYNPSMKSAMASVYRPWFVIVGLLTLFIGIASIVISVIMYIYDNDIRGDIFHLWVGIPLTLLGVMGLIAAAWRNKKFVVIFLMFAIVIMVVCSAGASISGVRFWMDGWKQTNDIIETNTCSDSSGTCVCKHINKMPANVDSCDDMEIMISLFITSLVLAAGGFVVCIMSIYLSMLTVCCAPFMYAEWYEEQYDPDFSNGKNVEIRKIGTTNDAYGY